MQNVTTLKIQIAKNTTAASHLEQLGYNFDGVEIDKRGKKHKMFSKDGIDFEFKGTDITNSDFDFIILQQQ